MKQISHSPSNPPGLLQRLLGIVVTAALVTLGLMFSAVMLAVIVIVVAMAGVYLWWKTREVRKQVRQMQETMRDVQARSAGMESDAAGGGTFRTEGFRTEGFGAERFRGEVIEGEVVRVDAERNKP